MKYMCKECGLAVVVTPKGNIRYCDHNDSPIIANMTAQMKVSVAINAEEKENDTRN